MEFVGRQVRSLARRWQLRRRSALLAGLLLTAGAALTTLLVSSQPPSQNQRVITRVLPAAQVDAAAAAAVVSSLFQRPWRHGAETAAALYGYLEHPEPCCRRLQPVGGRAAPTARGDGSKLICEDASLAPAADGCLVYSFGIANDWSFDQAMAERGCEVHSFDPSVERAEGPTEFGAVFHRWGLSGENGTTETGWRLATLGQLMDMLGHTGRTLDYLKVDVEGAEWLWLDAEEDSVLRRVRQIGMEVHFIDLQMDGPKRDKEYMLMWYYETFKLLHWLGFCLVSSRENPINPGRRNLPGMTEEKATLFEVVWVQR